MEYIVIGICLIAIVAIGARIFFKPKSKATVTPTVSVSPKEDEERSLSAPQGESAHDWVIQVEMLPAEAISEEGSLVEITDSKVLARVNNLIPNLVQAGNAVNNAVQAVEAQGEVLYRAIIPAGAKLTNSREMEGAVRGFYRGADGIQGHANLVVVEVRQLRRTIHNTVILRPDAARVVIPGNAPRHGFLKARLRVPPIVDDRAILRHCPQHIHIRLQALHALPRRAQCIHIARMIARIHHAVP